MRGGVGPPSCPDGLAPRCADRGAPTLHQAGAQQPTMGHQPGQSMSSSSPYYAVASSQASGTGYGQYGNLQSAMFSPAASPSYGSSGNSNPYPVSLPSSLSSLSSFAYPGVPPTANAAPSSFTANPYGSFYAPSPSVSSYPSSFVSQPSGVSSYLSSFYSQSTGVSPAYLSSFYSQPGSRTAQQPGSSTVQFPANRGAAAYSPYLQSSSNLSPSPYNLGPYGIAGFAEAQTGGQSPSYSYNNYPSPASYSLSPASYSSSASYNPSLTSAASDSPSYSPSPAYSLRSSGMMIPRG